MKNNPLSTLSTEELMKQKKSLTSIIMGIAIVMLIATCALLYLILKHKKYTLTALIPAFTVTLLPLFIRISQLNNEIKSRK